jgi:uncharacterized membrane protein
MKEIIYTYFLSLPIIFAFDMLWLGVFAKNYYVKMMSPIVEIQFNWFAVPVFYLFYIIGIFVFAVYPGVLEQNISKTLIMAALFGFFCYMTYDITNLATLKNWPLQLVLVDILWGTVLSTFTAFVAYYIYFWIK